MIRLVVVNILFLNSAFALMDYQIDLQGAKATVYSAYQEDAHFHIKRFELRPGRLEQLVEEKLFTKETDFDQFVAAHNLHDNQAAQPFLAMFTTKTEDSAQSVWETTEQWNDSWEAEYANWVTNDVDVDFFKRHNIVVDCADVVYALRWIFSRINGLPMAVTKEATRTLFTNSDFSRNWTKLRRSELWHEDQVFRKSLVYLLNLTSTRTLEDDTYPIKKELPILDAGVTNFSGGHTQVISKFDLKSATDYPAYTFESTLPGAARTLKQNA